MIVESSFILSGVFMFIYIILNKWGVVDWYNYTWQDKPSYLPQRFCYFCKTFWVSIVFLFATHNFTINLDYIYISVITSVVVWYLSLNLE